MKLTKRVGSLLNIKQRSGEPTFGERLYLEHIALAQVVFDIDSSLNTTETSEPDDMVKDASSSNSGKTRSSILDLDFMSAPLAEIELIHKKEQSKLNAPSQETAKAKMADQPPMKTPPDERPSPKQHINPAVSLDSDDHAVSDIEVEAIAPQQLFSTNGTDTALAQSLQNDDEIGVMVFSPAGNLLETSKSFERIVGMSTAENAKIKTYIDLLRYVSKQADLGDKNVEALSQKEAVKMQEQLAQGIYKNHTWMTTMRSGITLEFINKYTPNNHLVTLVQDVTERVEKNRLLRASLDLGTAGYWSYSFATGKSILSDYITNMLTYEERIRVETDGLISIIHPEDIDRVQLAFEEATTKLSRMDCEFRVVLARKGSAVLRMIGEVELSPLSQEPEVFIAFLNDLTLDRQRTKELNEVKELSRNKSEFLARMSHEIKTPLNAIVGMTDALRDEVDSPEARETASFIADAAENLNNILSQTLEHERLCTSAIILEEDNVNLNDIVKSSAAMWKKPCVDKGLNLVTRISPDLPKSIEIDSSRFRQCLTNLLSNAVKFTDNGSIVIAVAPMNLTSQNPKLLIAVKDTGIGMSAEAIENVFKPFQQGDASIQRRFGGSGLGMSITQHIVDAMDGQIKVKSIEGEGTTIAITLPLRLASATKEVILPKVDADFVLPTKTKTNTHKLSAETFHQSAPKLTQPAAPALQDTNVQKNVAIIPSNYSGFDVLVVEDNPINQAVVKKLLTNHIRSMDFAFHGQEAMEILETKTYDVILMDIHMPVKDGIETTLEIRNSGKAWADTVIVALTADPDYQQKRVCKNIGMNDALSKPIKRQELLDVLERVLRERQDKQSSHTMAMRA